MGWTPSSRKDLVTLTLAVAGPTHIHSLLEERIDEDDWQAAYRHERLAAERHHPKLYARALKDKFEAPALYFQSVYMLLLALERDGRVVREHKISNRWIWRVLSMADREAIAERARAAMVPPPELVAEVEHNAERLGYTVQLRSDFQDGIVVGVVEITTKRGRSDWTFGHESATGLTELRQWRPALKELGLL